MIQRFGSAQRLACSLLGIVVLLFAASAHAEDRKVPYWASIRGKARQVNMHVGPARGYRTSWLFRRPLMPLKVLRLQEAWRLVEDPDGQRGWMLQQFLSPERTGMINGSEPAEIREQPGSGRLMWRAEPGVVGKLGTCADRWCRFDMGGGHVGYAMQARLWGAGEP